jgi:hypothetical protein
MLTRQRLKMKGAKGQNAQYLIEKQAWRGPKRNNVKDDESHCVILVFLYRTLEQSDMAEKNAEHTSCMIVLCPPPSSPSAFTACATPNTEPLAASVVHTAAPDTT